MLSKLMSTQIMGLELSWARKIVTAIEHLCAFAIQRCNRKRYVEAKAALISLSAEELAPRIAASTTARRKAYMRKNREDADRLQFLPPTAVIKALNF